MRRVVDAMALALVLLAGSAEATVINGTNGAAIEYVSGGAVISDGSGVTFQGRNWTTPSGRTTMATDTNGAARIGGNTINLNAARTMTPIAVQRAGAALLRGLPVVGTGIAMWDIFNAARVQPDGSGGLIQDAGADPVTGPPTNVYRTGGTTTIYNYSDSPTQGGSCSLFNTANGRNGYHNLGSTNLCMTCAPGIVLNGSGTCTSGTVLSSTIFLISTTGGSTTCPASIDPLDPAYNVPAGEPLGPDGKCKRARYYWSSTTPTAAADLLEARRPPTAAELRQAAQDAIDGGEEIEASDRTMSGPASVTGSPTTTTTVPAGGGATTTTTRTPTTNYTFTGDTITYNTTTVTVTNVGGAVTTTTEVEGAPEESDACKENPDLVGCMKHGDPGATDPTWSTVNVPWEAEDLGFGSGECPADNEWSVFGLALNWGYQPVCDVAPMIRIALLLMASIAAISIVFKETSA